MEADKVISPSHNSLVGSMMNGVRDDADRALLKVDAVNKRLVMDPTTVKEITDATFYLSIIISLVNGWGNMRLNTDMFSCG